MTITHDFEDDPFGDGYTQKLAEKKVKQQSETCSSKEECESCSG